MVGVIKDNKTLKSVVLKQNNILLCSTFYHYVDHTNRLVTPGFKTKEALLRNTDIIRFDKNTLILMEIRYCNIFNV